MVATRLGSGEGKGAVHGLLKLVVRTQRVRVPTGQRLATRPGPSLASRRVTGAAKRRQEVNGPVCASPEITHDAAAETFTGVEGRTGPSARARAVGAAGVCGIGTSTGDRLQPGRPPGLPDGEEPDRVGEREGDQSAAEGLGESDRATVPMTWGKRW